MILSALLCLYAPSIGEVGLVLGKIWAEVGTKRGKLLVIGNGVSGGAGRSKLV